MLYKKKTIKLAMANNKGKRTKAIIVGRFGIVREYGHYQITDIASGWSIHPHNGYLFSGKGALNRAITAAYLMDKFLPDGKIEETTNNFMIVLAILIEYGNLHSLQFYFNVELPVVLAGVIKERERLSRG